MTKWQAPVSNRKAKHRGEFMMIVTHPAFRIGFLDAQQGKTISHDNIRWRIQSETPETALGRLGVIPSLYSDSDIEIAQYRYEEGRLASKHLKLRCRSWNHPDFPPASIRKFIDEACKR